MTWRYIIANALSRILSLQVTSTQTLHKHWTLHCVLDLGRNQAPEGWTLGQGGGRRAAVESSLSLSFSFPEKHHLKYYFKNIDQERPGVMAVKIAQEVRGEKNYSRQFRINF